MILLIKGKQAVAASEMIFDRHYTYVYTCPAVTPSLERLCQKKTVKRRD